MSTTAEDEGQGGRFGVKGVRTRRLPLAAIFTVFAIVIPYFTHYLKKLSDYSKVGAPSCI